MPLSRLFRWLFPSTDRELHKLRSDITLYQHNTRWLLERAQHESEMREQLTRLCLALVARVDVLEKAPQLPGVNVRLARLELAVLPAVDDGWRDRAVHRALMDAIVDGDRKGGKS